ncbi:choline ABC transporter substrate-binding protein [Aestuariivirga sp.]|uniref:choline ABC transporter substrate-binding protein n=1 Tax=Aestuariivirga sp. TaxID=2650926 RepID=UPI0039E300FE
MSFTFKTAAATLLLGVALAGPAFAGDADSCKTVRMSDVGWTDITAITAMTGGILEQMGYTGDIKQLAVPVTFASMKSGDIDVFLGNWMPSMEGDIRAYLDDKSVEQVSANLPEGAKYTLAVPQYTYDKGLHDFKDIYKFKDSLQGKFYGIEPGNDGNRHILDMIKDPQFKLDGFELVESSEAGMLSQVQKATSANEDIVFLGWAPHPMNVNFKMQYLTGGDALFGPNFGGAVVYSTVRKGYLDQCPNVGKFIKQLKFDVGMENEIMGQILNNNADPKEASIAWVKAHPDVLNAWLDGVTTFDGSGPAIDAVKKGLGIQ